MNSGAGYRGTEKWGLMDTVNETRLKVKRQIWIWGNGCRKKENDFLGFTRKILVESTEMCYDTSVRKIHAQIWFIGRTLASQAGKAGSTPVICSQKTWFCQFFWPSVIKTYVRSFSRILEFRNRAEYLALFIFVFSISVIMILSAKYICISHPHHNPLVVYLIIQKNAFYIIPGLCELH